MKSDGQDVIELFKRNAEKIFEIVDPLEELKDDTKQEKQKEREEIIKCFASLRQIFPNSSLNIQKMITKDIKIDKNKAQIFYEACRGHRDKIDMVLLKIGYKGNKHILLEFCNLLYRKDTDVKHIAQMLDVNQENADVLHALIHFYISVSSYYLLSKGSEYTKFIKTDWNTTLKDSDKLKMSEALLKRDITKRLTTLYSKQALDKQEYTTIKEHIDLYDKQNDDNEENKDQNFINKKVEKVLDKLGMKESMKIYFKSL